MVRPYSEDLRERIVGAVESGTSRNAAAKQFDVSISFVVKLMQRWRQRGTIKADKYGGWKKSKLAPHTDRIRALVSETCDITIDELRVALAAEGIEAKRSTLGDFLLARGLTRKKRRPTPPNKSALRHDRMTAPCVFDGAINGARFLAWVEQALVPTLANGDIVIMDNLGSHKGRRRARGHRGGRCQPRSTSSSRYRPVNPLWGGEGFVSYAADAA